jgi:hypothetical protein
MSVVFQWIGMALGFLVVALAIRVFWRGLSPKPHDTLPPGKRRNWRT